MKHSTFESLKDNSKITNLLNDGNKIHSKDLCFFYKNNECNTLSNVVIIIAKKKFKLAVIRNKIRRQIKSILIEMKLLKEKELSLVIIVKQTYDIEKFDENKKQIIKLIDKLGG